MDLAAMHGGELQSQLIGEVLRVLFPSAKQGRSFFDACGGKKCERSSDGRFVIAKEY